MSVDLPLTTSVFATAERFLWHGPSKTAVLADVHLGIEASLADQGIYLPFMKGKALRRQWGAMVGRGPARVVIAGDFFDKPEPTQQAVAAARGMMQEVPAACEVVVIRGNHDPASGRLVEILGKGVEIRSEVVMDEMVISHGDILPREEVWQGDWNCWVVGHQHPTVTFQTATQKAKMACYALSHFELAGVRRRLIVLPAFSGVSLGCNIREARQWMLPVARPGDEGIRIAGIVEGGGGKGAAGGGEGMVLDFGLLSGLEGGA